MHSFKTSPHQAFRKLSLFISALLCAGSLNACDDSSDSIDIPDPPVDINSPICGNTIVETGESCDDGNTDNDDGCSDKCATEDGWSCPDTGGSCTKRNPPKPSPKCGNNIVETGESCDDGNAINGDGCSDKCATEDGWSCPEKGGSCTEIPRCGDGKLKDGEQCDDGNNDNDDGCSDACTIESGWRCPIVGQPCAKENCGDEIVQDDEQCDDAYPADYGEGYCASNCRWAHFCGDGFRDEIDILNGEQCDSGKTDTSNDYNGCSATCQRVNYCGDGKIFTLVENCDDGNDIPGDGCSDTCQQEDNFACKPVDGKSFCFKILCGNGELNQNETCDDGNRLSGDGCSSSCLIEKGFQCVNDNGNSVCTPTIGNGILDDGEDCDDGNSNSNDGCSNKGIVEPGWYCPTPGTPCIANACGDGILAGNEECEDANTNDGDGCSKFCRRETGWHCPTPGTACIRDLCNDGIVTGDETCDEGTSTPSGGCVECQVQLGWKCETPGSPCTEAICGNGILEGAESCEESSECCLGCVIQPYCLCNEKGQNCKKGECGNGTLEAGEECDDGNLTAGDGCSPECKQEAIFTCTDGKCTATCGDGLTLWEAGEECDDGNLVNGDGCSSSCKIEKGYTCTDFSIPNPPTISLPITYRDFRGWHEGTSTAPGFLKEDLYKTLPDTCKTASTYRTKNFLTPNRAIPDFQSECLGQNCMNTVFDELDKDGKPILQPQTNFRNSSTGQYERVLGTTYTCPEVYALWYRDVPGLNVTIHSHLTLTQNSTDSGKYEYISTSFFPFINQGYHAPDMENRSPNSGTFTSEFETYFRFKGNEVLNFNGDDDAWVFINNRLAVDMGCMHGTMSRTITLNEATASKLHIYPNGIYSIKMFHAERCSSGTDGSTYRITLTGFVNMGTSQCSTICGDGNIRGSEECDLGGNHIDDAYAQMAGCVNCKLVPKCGNGKLESGEVCDAGHLCKENSVEGCTYHAEEEAAGCNDLCQNPNCNNGSLDPGEECDCQSETCLYADEKNDKKSCLNCKISGCGDGIVDTASGEECDDGNNSNEDMCTTACKQPYCGDGIVSEFLGEVCDNGINDGGYGSCGLGCNYLPPYCGDGILNGTETCDDGINDGSYGSCMPGCLEKAPHCGDSLVQYEFGETCDNGEENGVSHGCSQNCRKEIN